MKPRRIIDYCCVKYALNFGVHHTQNGQISAVFDYRILLIFIYIR